MQRKKLPIGIQTLAKICEDDAYYYVDKTPVAVKLVEQGSHYFLSRPRRFGKSLFLDTLKELFAGNAPLFTGLYAEKNWDWAVSYPVIRLNFAEGVWQSRETLDLRLKEILAENEERLGARGTEQSIAGRFGGLIRTVAEKYGQRVVVLVDDCDKPVFS